MNPDAELLRLEREHDALYTRIDAYNRRLVEDEEAFEADHDACCDVEYADSHLGGRVLDDMIPSLIEDILRIANVTGKRHLPYSKTQGT